MGFTTMLTLATILQIFELIMIGDFETLSQFIKMYLDVIPQAIEGFSGLLEQIFAAF